MAIVRSSSDRTTAPTFTSGAQSEASHLTCKDRFFYYILDAFAKVKWRRAVEVITNHLSGERISRIFQKATSLNNTLLVERMPIVEQPLLTGLNYDKFPSQYQEVTASYNQTNTPNERRGQVQPCGSNALAFLNEIFQKKRILTPKELDEILEEGRLADIGYRQKDPDNLIIPNEGVEFSDLHSFHNGKKQKTFGSIDFEKVSSWEPLFAIEAKKDPSEMDFSKLKNKIKNGSGALIYKGGKTYAIYKDGDSFYFFDSHETKKYNRAYLIKSTDVNEILRSVEYLSFIPDDAGEYSPHRQIQIFEIKPF